MFFVGGKGSEKNAIYKYLLGSLILTFPICSEDNINIMLFLGYTLKGLAGFPISSRCDAVSCYGIGWYL